MSFFKIDNKSLQKGSDILFPENKKESFFVNTEVKNGPIRIDTENFKITYSEKSDFYYALSILKENFNKKIVIEKHKQFENLTLMLDISRDAVHNQQTLYKMVCMMVKMGFNRLMLYTEDLFELKDYPYFGYNRGRFTAGEIIRFDKLCASLGIELIPCIQTLAHFTAYKRWKEFKDISDIDDILLHESDNTYTFIEALLKFVKSNFTSNKIMLGMDEAYLLGRGKYLDKFGYCNRTELMQKHIAKVMPLCEKYHLKPMIWSDMFFSDSLTAQYNTDLFDSNIHKEIPENLKLVYWEYCKSNSSDYLKMIDKHLRLTENLAFAGAACRHVGFAPFLTFSLRAGRAALQACREKNIQDILLTCWTSVAGECSPFVSLPVMQFFGEAKFNNLVDLENIKTRFASVTGASWDDFMTLEELNDVDGKITSGDFVDPCKYLFYADVLYGMFNKHIEIGKFNEFYKNLSMKYVEMEKRNGEFNYLFRFARAISDVLKNKSELSLLIKNAYRSKDKKRLNSLLENELLQVISDTKTALNVFESVWNIENKPFGLEVMQIRMGGMLARLEYVKKCLTAYLLNETDIIEELETDDLSYDLNAKWGNESICTNSWASMVSPAVLDLTE